MVTSVLVVIDEDADTAFLFPPLRCCDLRHAPFDFPCQRERTLAHVGKTPPRLYGNVYVDPSATGSLWETRHTKLVEDLVHTTSDPTDVVESHPWHRVKVDTKFVGTIEIGIAHWPRVEIDTTEVHRPNDVRDVEGAELLG
jgi:hypothetical protein